GLLYSGGTDSSLAALVLDPFYDVTLVTVHFGVTGDWRHAREAAEALDFDFSTLELDREIAVSAVERIREDGFPRNGIQAVHHEALEALAADEELDFDAIADGTRRDDRVPTTSRAQAQSLEETYEIDYIAPLSGFGRRAVDRLVESELRVTAGPSEEIHRADYESELRALFEQRFDDRNPGDVFPNNTQTYVDGRKT
ncbi:MAG: alpha hydrolase, partial [Halodesulfurarchaeum sp.]